MAAAAKKKVFVFSPKLASVGVHKKEPESRKYGMSDRSDFESGKEKDDDFQPTKKSYMKLSAPKGKQGTSLKHYHWRSISKCMF